MRFIKRIHAFGSMLTRSKASKN